MGRTVKRRPRVLIVNAYVHPWRSATPSRLFIPRAMAPYHLAGAFDPTRVDVRVHEEVYDGAFLDPKLYAWPDVLILTGLTAAFDRARQIAAYVRNARPDAVTVIGGPIARALPKLCRQIYDYVCRGDVDEIAAVGRDILGPDAIAETSVPRFDLTGGPGLVGYLETTVNCNFACAFCSLTGENRAYRTHPLADLSRQIEAMGRVRVLALLDNNFYGSSRAGFIARTELLGEHWRRGAYRGWIALVTGDFFAREENIAFVAKHGCIGLFSGVESLDPAVLKSYNKRQSLLLEPGRLSRACAEHGIVFDYGLLFDFGAETVASASAQIDHILSDPEVPLPAFLSLTIPILGTPYFDTAVQARRLMPNLRLADLDGRKLVEWPKEPLETVAPFVRDLLMLRGRKARLARHAVAHALTRRRAYRIDQTLFNLVRPMVAYGTTVRVGTARQMLHGLREAPLTACAMTDPLSAMYTPNVPLASRFEADFQPLHLTDEHGALTDTVANRLDTPLAAAAS